jgi:hypothetical protein
MHVSEKHYRFKITIVKRSNGVDIPSMHEQNRFKLPFITQKADGTPRLVGFELEFSGLTLDQTVGALQTAMGGELRSGTAAEQVVHVDALGNFNIELDWNYLKRKASENHQKATDDKWIEQLSQAAALLVPTEMVCPPIPITRLDVLEPMVAALRKAGAVGTEESLLAAYGVHINTEIPRLDAATLSSYLKAFAVLQWWLIDAHDVNTTRKLSPYIDPYPEAYLKQILEKTHPSMDDIFADYLEYNPTRNRSLDLLPLLAEIDEDRIRKAVNDPKIKARPAFHYRLPNCHIEHSDWSLAAPWNTWWVVEQLAHRPDDLDELSTAFLKAGRPIFGIKRNEWVEGIQQWLTDHGLA